MAPLPIPPPRESGFTQSTTLPLYWCKYGPAGAPPLLVLHGGPGAHHDYLLPHFLDLADQYDLIFYDQRGGGKSKTDDAAPTGWQTHVADLEFVVRELLCTAPTIVGYSWGALLALLYAIEATCGRRAPLPAALALVDPAPASRAYRATFEAEFSARSNGPTIQAMRADLAASGLRDRDPAAYRHRAFELSVAGYFADSERAADLTPFRVTGRVQTQVWESLGDFNVEPALRDVRLPAMIVHGRQDPIPLASSEAVARALGAPLIVLEDCGHVPYVERRAELFAALRTFLGSAGLGSPPAQP
ncbi:MAG: alpha/beta hydrolase [Gemmatimonadota bacterium]|nr:alpha/beta hydrolase [Gemmatimonadota bacterium]